MKSLLVRVWRYTLLSIPLLVIANPAVARYGVCGKIPGSGETPQYVLAYGESGHRGEYSRREASPWRFQWLRNPAANRLLYARGIRNSWSGDSSVGCTVGQATGSFYSKYYISGSFEAPGYLRGRRETLTVDTSEFLGEYRRDGDDIRDLLRDAGVSSSSLVNHVPADLSRAKDGIKVTFFGTSTFLFEDGASRILIDGFFTRPNIIKLLLPLNEPDREVLDSVVNNFDLDGAQGGDPLDAIVAMHPHHDHAMDIPYILTRMKQVNAKPRLISDESTRNVIRGYGRYRHGSLSYYDSFFKGDAEDGTTNRVYKVGKFKIIAMKTAHAPIPSIVDKLIGRGLHITAPISPKWKLEDFKEGDAYTLLIKHPKGKFLIWIGGPILNTKPLFKRRNGRPIHIDTMFVSAGGTRDEWDKVGGFISDRVMPHGASRVIPVHWDSQFSEGENSYYNSTYREGIEGLARKIRYSGGDAKFMVAPVNTFWYENHSVK